MGQFIFFADGIYNKNSKLNHQTKNNHPSFNKIKAKQKINKENKLPDHAHTKHWIWYFFNVVSNYQPWEKGVLQGKKECKSPQS